MKFKVTELRAKLSERGLDKKGKKADLVKRLQTIFRRLDTDNSGGLSHQELFEGLKKMQFNPAIKLSIEEFNRITQDRRLCNEEGEIEMRHWEGIMLGQLKLYAERMLGQSISAVTEDNDHMATLMFALQIMQRNTLRKFKCIPFVWE